MGEEEKKGTLVEQEELQQPKEEKEEEKEKEKKELHFVLVHGLSHGAWCWYKIRSPLESSGHRVSCIDLAGAGIHPAQADAILTFDEYNKPLVDFMAALPPEEKVILVGHSAGGLSVTDISHKFPEKIHLAIYIAASMLKSGLKSDDDFKNGIPDFSEFGDVFEFGFGLGPSAPPTAAVIRKEFQRKMLYYRCPDEDSILASMLLRPGPLLALTKVTFDGGDAIEGVPRVYIKTSKDILLKPAQQDAMVKKWAPDVLFAVEGDHSPFFSATGELLSCLLKAGALVSENAHQRTAQN